MDELTADPEKLVDTICIHIASGGSLIDLCETWDVRYAEVWNWMNKNQDAAELYADALNARNEWSRERILLEFRRLSLAEHTQFYDDKGKVKPMDQWTPEMKSIVKDVYFNEKGKISRVSFWNKEKSLELLGKNIAMFNEHHVVSGRISLEELVNASREIDDEE